MKVTVYHKDFETTDQFKKVAYVWAEGIDNEKEACEYAYRWTQNIHDSWSHPKGVQDKNENVVILGELPVRGGKTFGMRSSMMGDRMYCGTGEVYEVAMLGFEQVQ